MPPKRRKGSTKPANVKLRPNLAQRDDDSCAPIHEVSSGEEDLIPENELGPLLRCVVCFTGIRNDNNKRDQLVAKVEELKGVCDLALTGDVTHLVYADTTSQKYNQAKEVNRTREDGEPEIKLVTPEWLEDLYRRWVSGEPVPAERTAVIPVSEEAARRPRNSKKRKIDAMLGEPMFCRSPAESTPSSAQGQPHLGSSSQGSASIISLSEAGPLRLPFNEQPSDHQQTDKQIFRGVSVCYTGLPKQHIKNITDAVRLGGGTIRYVSNAQAPELRAAQYLVVPFLTPPKWAFTLQNIKLVSEAWIERSLYEGTLVEPQANFACRPLRFSVPTGFTLKDEMGVMLCGFDECDRVLLTRFCGNIGVQILHSCKRTQLTHFICPKDYSGAKKDRVSQWGVPILDAQDFRTEVESRLALTSSPTEDVEMTNIPLRALDPALHKKDRSNSNKTSRATSISRETSVPPSGEKGGSRSRRKSPKEPMAEKIVAALQQQLLGPETPDWRRRVAISHEQKTTNVGPHDPSLCSESLPPIPDFFEHDEQDGQKLPVTYVSIAEKPA